MRQFRVTNASGLFYAPQQKAVISEASYQKLLSRLPAIAEPSEREAAEIALAAVGSLPVFEIYHERGPLDPGHVPKPDYWRPEYAGQQYRDSAPLACRGWIALETPKGASPSAGFIHGSPEECGWTGLAAIERHRGVLEKMLADAGAPKSLAFIGKSGSLLLKKASGISFSVVDEEGEIMGSQSVALFHDGGVSDSGRLLGGFMDSKGRFGPLSRARMFESAAAAGRTAASHRLSNWSAVGVSMTISEVFELKGSTPSARLLAAIASKEATDLDKMLGDADIAALRQKLSDIEASRSAQEPPARPKPRSRL